MGWNNEQFAVYYGQEYPTTSCTVGCVGGGAANISSPGPRTVLMWNAEYNTYGNGSNINLTYKYNSDGTWKKYYNINDRLGNVRTVLRKDGTAGTPVKQFFYTPFGSVIPLLGDVNRTKFIGKEKDKESNYADHGVRKYDDEIGRFTSIDPLWEKYYSLTPYQYAGNNPVIAKDADGRETSFTTLFEPVNKSNYPSNAQPLTIPDIVNNSDKPGNQKLIDNLFLIGVTGLFNVAVDAFVASKAAKETNEAVKTVTNSAKESKETIETTKHGASRIADGNATRGGVLNQSEIGMTNQYGQSLTQSDGAVVKVLKINDRFNVTITGEKGLITTFKNISQKSLERLSKNYGWK